MTWLDVRFIGIKGDNTYAPVAPSLDCFSIVPVADSGDWTIKVIL